MDSDLRRLLASSAYTGVRLSSLQARMSGGCHPRCSPLIQFLGAPFPNYKRRAYRNANQDPQREVVDCDVPSPIQFQMPITFLFTGSRLRAQRY
jgi:hypothetical protein